jgi:hypothetical protein
MTFYADLKLGHKYEDELLKYVEHDEYEKVEGYFKAWDIKFSLCGNKTTYEVKCDRLAHKTGNLAVEYRCRDKPSGISTTTADYWAFFVIRGTTHDCYIIKTSVLKERISNGEFMERTGGDNHTSNLYIMPIRSFKEYLVKPSYEYIYE